MDTRASLLILCLALWAPGAPAAFLSSLFRSGGSSQSSGSGTGSSYTPGQFGASGGGSVGNAESNTSQSGFIVGWLSGSASTDLDITFKDSSFNNANGAGSSTQGRASSDGVAKNGGWGLFGFGKASSSSKAEMNSRAQTVWRPDGPYGPSGSVATGGGTAEGTADSNSNNFGLSFSSGANTKSSVDTNIKTFGNDNGSGTTGSVVGDSKGSSLLGNSESKTAVQMAGSSQHAGPYGTSTASAGGQGFEQSTSEVGSNSNGRTSTNIRVTQKTFAGNGHSSSSSSIRG